MGSFLRGQSILKKITPLSNRREDKTMTKRHQDHLLTFKTESSQDCFGGRREYSSHADKCAMIYIQYKSKYWWAGKQEKPFEIIFEFHRSYTVVPPLKGNLI